MLEEPPVLKVRRQFTRPSAEDYAPLRDTCTCFIADAMGGRGAVDYRIKPLDETCSCFVGVAITCHAGPADNLAVRAAIELSKPGDVIVVATDEFTGTACTGDLLVGIMKNRGVTAFVTDGVVRDIDDMIPIGLPVFSRGLSPNSGTGSGPGTVGLPITLGQVTVEAGDLVVGDRNGVAVVPRLQLAQVCRQLEQIRVAEADFARRVRDGQDHIGSIRELLASDRVQNVE
jgi:4-hydroxy-4-methyl-2-oxoglutarate aldolase